MGLESMRYNSYTIPEFEYDPDKDDANYKKHGVYLVEAQELWTVNHAIATGTPVRGELRNVIIGKLRDKIYMAVYTLRGKKVRLITFHRADSRLERIYAEKTYH